MKPTTGAGQAVPLPDQGPNPDDEQQGLLPGLLANVRNYRRVPPERALYRELVMAAVGRTAETYIVGGFRVSALVIKAVAWTLFGRMNAAGVLVDDEGQPFSRETYARDASSSIRAVRAALGFLKQARVIAVDPARGRQREIIRLNPGGLEWKAVRRRVKISIADRGTSPRPNRQLSLLSDRKGDSESTLRRRRGDSESPQEKYVRRGQISEPIAAAGTSRARSADHRQEQQQRDQARIEGLLAAIAARARQLGHAFDEGDERRRVAEGEIDVAALQALADDLEAELADRGDVRRHRITPGLDGGGRCAVCGRRPSSEMELCPGRPRRGRIEALAEDRAEENRC